MCSSRFAGRALAVVLAVSVGLVLAACASNPGTAAAPDGSSSAPKLTGEWPSMPNDDASLNSPAPRKPRARCVATLWARVSARYNSPAQRIPKRIGSAFAGAIPMPTA